jgi:hypothetical protein
VTMNAERMRDGRLAAIQAIVDLTPEQEAALSAAWEADSQGIIDEIEDYGPSGGGGGGVTDHAALTGLGWDDAGHTPGGLSFPTSGVSTTYGAAGWSRTSGGTIASVILALGSAGGLQGWSLALDNLVAMASGFVTRTGTNTWEARTIQSSGSGLAVTNGTGGAGNPTIALADDVAAIEALTGTGAPFRIGLNDWRIRVFSTSGVGLSITDGDGVGGAPTWALASQLQAVVSATVTTGTLLVGGSDALLGALSVGSNGQVLIADSGEPRGVRWGTLTAALVGALAVDGSNSPTAHLDLGGYRLGDVGDAVSGTDAPNLAQVEALIAGFVTGNEAAAVAYAIARGAFYA